MLGPYLKINQENIFMKWENSRDFGPLLIVRDRLIQLDDMISVKIFFFDDMIESSTWEGDEMQ